MVLWKVIKDKTLSVQAKLLYHIIFTLANSKYGCIAENGTLAKLMGKDVRSLNRYLKELYDLKYIKETYILRNQGDIRKFRVTSFYGDEIYLLYNDPYNQDIFASNLIDRQWTKAKKLKRKNRKLNNSQIKKMKILVACIQKHHQFTN